VYPAHIPVFMVSTLAECYKVKNSTALLSACSTKSDSLLDQFILNSGDKYHLITYEINLKLLSYLTIFINMFNYSYLNLRFASFNPSSIYYDLISLIAQFLRHIDLKLILGYPKSVLISFNHPSFAIFPFLLKSNSFNANSP